MNRKMFMIPHICGGGGRFYHREDPIFDNIRNATEGKTLDNLTVGETAHFTFVAVGTEDMVGYAEIRRVGDDVSISYGPFLTAKQYELAAAHMRQAMEELRLAAHYVEGDPPLGSGVQALRDKINDMREAFLKLKALAETPEKAK